MKNYSFYVKGIRFISQTEKRPFSENGTVSAFNLNHALSHVLNLAKESKVSITGLTISENV